MIPNEYVINDTRDIKELNKKSFSGYEIKTVVSALSKCLMECKIEETVNWAIELLISGHVEKLWEKIFSIYLKNININNPKLPNFLYKRYSRFVELKLRYTGSSLQSGGTKSRNTVAYLSLRNSQIVRNLICEICVVICNSTKLKAIVVPKIKLTDFDSNYIKTKLVASSPTIINDKLKFGDPEELRIPLNEFNFCIKTRKWELILYWLAWIVEWERRNTKKDRYYICGYRKIDGVDTKYCTDIIWMIWEIIIKEAVYLKDSEASLQIYSLFKLYKYDFKPTKKPKRIYFIVNALKYFTEMYSFKQDIIPNYYQLVQACSNINLMFYEKRRYEVNRVAKKQEKKLYSSNVNTMESEYVQKQKKEELKRLKQIAEIKMKNKISAVEKIDSMILNQPNPNI